jgi:septal ring factor EnvC (AmiA/AmiB activator)
MKQLPLLLCLVLGILMGLPCHLPAKDSDDWSKVQKDMRNRVKQVQKNWDLHRDRVKYLNGDRRQWQQMQAIRSDIDDISARVESGRFDPRDIRNRIDRANADLDRVQAQLDYKRNAPSGPPQGGFYRPY